LNSDSDNQAVLIVVSSFTPSTTVCETIDAALAFAIFDIDIDVYFTKNGVSQLDLNAPAFNEGKILAKQWRSAEIYGVRSLLVDAASTAPNQNLIDEAVITNHMPDSSNYKHVLHL